MQLPIESHLAKLVAGTLEKPCTVIKAEPGAGKTTLYPKALLEALSGKIFVLEPRRLAAKLAASWVASGLGQAVGDEVGYAIRHDVRVQPSTRLVYQTEGLFIRTLLSNPELKGVDCVIIDEFHERHIYTDESLALLRQLQRQQRPDLKIVLMSATIDTRRLERYLQIASVFNVPGRTFPVETQYFGTIHDSPEQHFISAAQKIWQDPNCPGDILVFLAGRAEISECETQLRRSMPGVKVVALTADMNNRQQQEAFAEQPRKFILATNVAETSLTLPAVTGVLDLGKAKISSHAPWSGMPTLEVKKVSRDSCIQRAGRAGRTQAGVCYRLYSEDDFKQRDEYTAPEISRIDLCHTLLDMVGILDRSGHGNVAAVLQLPWFDAPEPQAVEAAVRTLQLIEAIDPAGNLTPVGRKMCLIPIHPRLARVMVAAETAGKRPWGVLAASLIQERGLLRPNYQAFANENCDVAFQMGLLAKLWSGQELDSVGLERQISKARLIRIEQTYDLLMRNFSGSSSTANRRQLFKEFENIAVTEFLLKGFPDRVAKKRQLPVARQKKKRDQRGLFNLALGRGAILSEESVAQKPEFILALDATESLGRDAARGTLIRMASGVSLGELIEGPAQLVTKTRQPRWNEKKSAVELAEVVGYGSLEIGSIVADTLQEEDLANAEKFFTSKVLGNLQQAFPEDVGLELYHSKLNLLESHNFDCTQLPRFEGEMLELFVEEICAGVTSYGQLRRKNLAAHIEDQLSWEHRSFLKNMLPESIRLANGQTKKVLYSVQSPPVLEGYIQDFFGVVDSPTLAEGRIVLSLRLLGPNKRPVQTTADLKNYWRKGYPVSVTELSRRYPRHHWPSDPGRAPPVLHKNRLKSND